MKTSKRCARTAALLAGFISLAPGCGGSDDDGGGGSSGGACGGLDTSSCAVALEPGDDDTEAVQQALIDAQSGDTICFCPGTYSFERELSLNVPDVSLVGLGASREDVVLDFASQTVGDDGVTVTSDGFEIRRMWIKNTPGNGIVVSGADGVAFRDLKVSWDAGSVEENGAYAVYPVKSRNVIVEDSEVIGAADAGVYVGQCERAVVRNNVVHGNVAGIEIENTSDAEVYENEAYDNTAGVLVFVLPNLERKVNERTLVRDNVIRENNRANFAEEGSIVSVVPAGTGMLLLSADETEVKNNEIRDNESLGVLLISGETLAFLLDSVSEDPETDGYPEKTFIHDNQFSNNGGSPKGPALLLGAATLEDVVWDGIEGPNPAELCLGNMPPSFRNIGGEEGVGDTSKHSTDATPHQCTLDPLPGVTIE